MKTETKTLTVCGDKISIQWDGNCWVSPTNGRISYDRGNDPVIKSWERLAQNGG
jgi:hypothetical protein